MIGHNSNPEVAHLELIEICPNSDPQLGLGLGLRIDPDPLYQVNIDLTRISTNILANI